MLKKHISRVWSYKLVLFVTNLFHLLQTCSICYKLVPFVTNLFYLLQTCSICYKLVLFVKTCSICYKLVLFVTGTFLRRLENGLRGISHVIVDEIHERDLNVRTDIVNCPFYWPFARICV